MPAPRLHRRILATLLFGSLALACGAPRAAPEPGTKAEKEQDARLDWWREARFGLFIHWGLYAVPAGEWKGGTDYGEWIRESAHIPLAEYERFQGQFNPVRFDPDAWVALAREAGMRYLVITSKHHDGFGLFDSAETDWDVMGTPFRRDILAELSDACARGGVRFCTYHSIMDWHHPDYLPRRSWEADRLVAGADFGRFEDYLHAQVREVITKYRPGVMWFDGEWENTWNHARGVRLYELCRALDPDLIVNNRVDVHRGGMAGFSESSEAVGDFGTPEQEIPATGLPGVDWETCMTMNDHWGWNKSDPDWKPVEVLVRNLIDVASKGGNYLLNVGPKTDGTFPDEAIERLKGIGVWMKKHGEAIYGTSASPFEGLLWGRCTMKPSGADTILYLHLFERPTDGRIVLPGLGNEPLSAGWLAGPRVQLPVTREGADVVVQLPPDLPDPIAAVVTLGIRGAPIVYRAPEIVAESDVFVRPLSVRIATKSPGLEIRYTLDGSEPTLDSRRYVDPLELTRSTLVRARSFHAGEAVSGIVSRRFDRLGDLTACFMNSVAPQGLWVERFPGDWNALPDLDAMAPVSRTPVTALSIQEVGAGEHVGLRFRGYLRVHDADVYTLALSSDDGSALWIDRTLVLDNDGLHGTLEKRVQVPLGVGDHEVDVRWFNKTGGAELGLQWARLGAELEPVREFYRDPE